MGKTYIDTVKYLVYTNVDIGGLVEKPDVVGAIFGQTEGLLGDELDLRDLQKNGRIGRIEVDLSGREGRTVGTIKIPSSLDMVETCIIAAALETVDRIGPCEARLKVMKVEDTRNLKRKALVDRAKSLLKNLLVDEIPESKEISDMVRDEVKMAEIVEFGPDRLSAGPGVTRSDEVILVEGRADVVNMLKNDITNVVAIGGAKVPRSIPELSRKKEVTAFLDGDRGGDIILNELVQGGVEVEFVARAPQGKEVEELTRKELIKCIRSKVPFEDASAQKGGSRRYEERPDFRKRLQQPRRPEFQPRDEQAVPDEPEREKQPEPEKIEFERAESPPVVDRPIILEPAAPAPIPMPVPRQPQRFAEPAPKASSGPLDMQFLMRELDGLNNTLSARFYGAGSEKMAEMKVRDVIKSLEESRNVQAIVFDGIITQRLVDLAANKGVKVLVGVKIGNVNKRPAGIEIATKAIA
jgi:DNA primase